MKNKIIITILALLLLPSYFSYQAYKVNSLQTIQAALKKEVKFYV